MAYSIKQKNNRSLSIFYGVYIVLDGIARSKYGKDYKQLNDEQQHEVEITYLKGSHK